MSPTPEARRKEHDARFGAARDGVAVLGPDWRIRYMNASMLEILRLIGGTARVETLWDVLPQWERSEPAETLRRAMETGAAVCFRVDGERGRGRVWEVQAEPLESGDLRLRVRNVTAQARVEEAEHRRAAALPPAEREMRLAAAVAGAPVGIVLMDAADLTVREANAFYHRFLEGEWSRPGAIVGHRWPEFIPGFEEAGLGEIVRRVRESGEAFEISEFEFRGFERGTTYFRWTLQPVGAYAEYLLLLVVDVTGQVVARRAAEAEHRALYDVLDTLPVGVMVAEAPTGRVAYVNAAAVALGGRSREELSAGELAEYAGRWSAHRPSGEPFPDAELPIIRALGGHVVRDVEVVLRPPGGAERTVVASAVPLRDGEGRVDRALAVFYDLTERLGLEQALLERTREAEAAASEAALRAEESHALREIGRALVSELEPERVLELAARSAMELLGTRAALVATPIDGERIRISPALGALADLEGRVAPLRGSAAALALDGDGGTRVFDDATPLPPGSPLYPLMEARGIRNAALVPLRAFGAPVGVLAVVDRVTPFTDEDVRLLEGLASTAALAIHNAAVYAGERRRGDENRALLAAAEALTSTLDVDEVMQRIASIARELTGAEGAGLSTLEGEKRDRMRMVAAVGMLEPLAGMDVPAEGTVTHMVASAGQARRLSMADLGEGIATRDRLCATGVEHGALVPLPDGEGAVAGMLSVVNGAARGPFSDEQLRVVSLLAAQAALSVRNARLYQAAQAASRAKGEFLAMMSHELRTPLNGLEGYASLMEDGIYGPVTEAQHEALRRMRAARRHLMELIESVLDLSRVEAGTRRAEPQDVALGPLVASVAEAMRGAAEAKKLELAVDTARAGRLRTDPGLLRQVLTNLLGNAIKFTGRGEVAVRAWSEAGRAVMEVEDTGPGIAAEHRQRVFEPFFQVDPSITRKEGGSGLGLALSADFVRLLGGELSVESEPGRGTTFRVVLPERAETD